MRCKERDTLVLAEVDAGIRGRGRRLLAGFLWFVGIPFFASEHVASAGA